jgi:uncharacterized membrane protein YeiB
MITVGTIITTIGLLTMIIAVLMRNTGKALALIFLGIALILLGSLMRREAELKTQSDPNTSIQQSE